MKPSCLIDEYQDSRLICNLLVAYGYAREPYEKDDNEPASEVDTMAYAGETDEPETNEE